MGGEGWLNYDIQFRMRMHWNPQSSWGVLDQELWSYYVVIPGPGFSNHTPSTIDTSDSGSYYNQGQGYQRRGGSAIRGSGSGGQSQGSGRPCFKFNEAKGCSRSDCRFRHSCMSCNKSGHGASQCWFAKPEKSEIPKNAHQ